MSHTLSGGIIADILDGKKPIKPKVQILGQKQIAGANTSANNRYRLLISDGIFTHSSALIAIQLNPMIASGELDNYTIVQLNEYNVNDLPNGKKVLIIIEIDIITPGAKVGDRIGTPSPYKPGDKKPAEAVKKEGGFYGEQNNKENKFSVRSKQTAGGDACPLKIYPIMTLTPYQNKWTIRARVSNKSDIRTWNNARGSGKLCSVTLTDESGQIKATMFQSEVDKFYDLLVNDKVYYIGKAQLKTANKQFNTLKNEYELTFSGDTTVEICEDDVVIPLLEYTFCKIQDIQDKEPNTTIDVIGVLKSVGDITSIITKVAQKQLSKLELSIVDQGLLQINLTLWGTQAENFSESGNPVIAIRDAKVSDWNGRSLSVSNSSEMTINPDVSEAKALRSWYDTEGSDASLNVYARDGATGDKTTQYMNLVQVEQITSKLTGDNAVYFNNDGMMIFVKKENCLYKSCPNQKCNKKLVELGNDSYRCEKCSSDCTDFEWRMLLQAHFCDSTGDIWATCFNDSAEALLGLSIKSIAEMRDEDDEAFNKVFEDALFKPYTFKYRSKMDTYNDESRLKTVIVSATAIDYAEKNKRLLGNLELLLAA